MTIPAHCRVFGRSPNQFAETMATSAGWRFTSETEAATLVYRSDVFQLQKCSASITPPAPASRRSVRRRAAHFRQLPVRSNAIATKMSENPIRHVAITNGAEADKRISGAAKENPITDAANTSTGGAGGDAAKRTTLDMEAQYNAVAICGVDW